MNPFLKTLVTLIGGAVLPAVDGAITSVVPTGGFAHTLASQPVLAALFAAGLFGAHNAITVWEAQLGVHPAQTSGATTAPAPATK